MAHTLYQGDCLVRLKQLADNSIDSVVADPPSGIAFMNAEWDKDKGGRDKWIEWLASIMREALRVLKPGGHAAIWSLPRTSHWTGMALELAGFEVRDCIANLYDSGRDVQAFMETLSPEQAQLLEIILANGDDSFLSLVHCFGSGFPKSLDISKAIDASMGLKREVMGKKLHARDGDVSHQKWSENSVTSRLYVGGNQTLGTGYITAPASAEAKQWDGWGSATKPAHELWWLVRKPLGEPTIAANVLKWGVGGLNIDASRIPTGDDENFAKNWDRPSIGDMRGGKYHHQSERLANSYAAPIGRFPSNIIHDGSATVEAEFAKAGVRSSGAHKPIEGSNSNGLIEFLSGCNTRVHSNGGNPQNTGSASRFFYCAKPSPGERNEGLDGFEESFSPTMGNGIGVKPHDPETATKKRNIHPTCKSITLMQHLIKLITPPNGVVLDMFMGSGTTGVAAIKNGFSFIGIEKERPYFEIAQARIAHVALGDKGEIFAPEPIAIKPKVKLQPSLF